MSKRTIEELKREFYQVFPALWVCVEEMNDKCNQGSEDRDEVWEWIEQNFTPKYPKTPPVDDLDGTIRTESREEETSMKYLSSKINK